MQEHATSFEMMTLKAVANILLAQKLAWHPNFELHVQRSCSANSRRTVKVCMYICEEDKQNCMLL